MQTNQALLVARARHLAASGKAEQIRRDHDLSLGEMGGGIGTGASTIWRWEKGGRKPRGALAAAWAQLLDELDREAAGRSA